MATWLRKPPGDITVLENPIIEGEMVAANLEQNEALAEQVFQRCSDLVCRKIDHGGIKPGHLIVYLSTLADENKVNEQIVKPLIALEGEAAAVSKKITVLKWPEIVRFLLRGYTAVFTEGSENADCFAVENSVQRSIDEPTSEPVIRGSKEGFIERLPVNLGILRNYIHSPFLKMESFNVGDITDTEVTIVYMEGLADVSVVDQIRTKIMSIRIAGVLESGYIEEQITDNSVPVFPLVQVTERPDAVAGGLLEGRVAIMVDNTPFVLIAPITFWNGLQASEDYYLRYPVATFIRWIRFLFLFIAIFAPSIFVAVTTFHQEMIPTSLLLSIASSHEPVPFPIMLEALLMEITFEALREAGLRLPRTIGQTISIVGALVIGQAAVQAGIISAPIVIVVSTTGIAAFVIPRFSLSNGVRLLRFPVILLAGSLGLYGVALGFLGILLRLVSLKSFGVPYLTPVTPFSIRALKDVLFRTPKSNNN
jgi:spore germination protein